MGRTSFEPETRATADIAAVVGWGGPARPIGNDAETNIVASRQAARPWWLWPHLLGLDAAMVALVWQDWWSRTGGVRLPFSQRAILGLGVWMVYLIDRLADTGRGSPGDHATARHAFASDWRGPLRLLTMFIAATLAMLTILTLQPGEFYRGLVLLAAAAVYLLLIHRRSSQAWTAQVPKETVVGAIFALGSAFFVWCRPSLPSVPLAVALLLFGIACSLNCALITSWERNPCDLRDPHSFLNTFPRLATRGLRPFSWWLAGLAGVAGGVLPATAFLPVAMGALLLGSLDRWRSRFSPDALRSLADAALLTPLVFDAIPNLFQ